MGTLARVGRDHSPTTPPLRWLKRVTAWARVPPSHRVVATEVFVLEGIAGSLALVASLSISLDGEPVGQATTVEVDAKMPDRFTVRDMAITREPVARWLNGGTVDGQLELVGTDRRGTELFRVDANQLQVFYYAHGTPRGEQLTYTKLVIVDPSMREKDEEEGD